MLNRVKYGISEATKYTSLFVRLIVRRSLAHTIRKIVCIDGSIAER